jgi:tRNA pseudouridine55 synthase
VFRLGVATDTNDAEGTAAGPAYQGPLPSREAIDRALDAFRGTFLQQPPAYSAKKIDGHRSYRLARQGRGRSPDPVSVTAGAIDIVSVDGDCVTLHVTCSAGFYVRALAHDLGAQLGCGAHLLSLCRTRSGDATLDQALALDAIERDPGRGLGAVVPLSQMLPGLSSVMLTTEGVRHAVHGRDIGPADAQDGMGFVIRDLGFGGSEGVCESRIPNPESRGFIRLLDPTGELVGIASPAGASGLLHPAVVLM